MPRNVEVVTERMKRGECPICGKNIDGKTMLVFDPNFGEVSICESHIVHGLEKLREDDTSCGQAKVKDEVAPATTEK